MVRRFSIEEVPEKNNIPLEPLCPVVPEVNGAPGGVENGDGPLASDPLLTNGGSPSSDDPLLTNGGKAASPPQSPRSPLPTIMVTCESGRNVTTLTNINVDQLAQGESL